MRITHPFPQPARARVDAKFLDPRYPGWRRAMGLPPDEHPGVDYNLEGTHGDGDLGYPVVAVAEGTVVHAAFHRVWGNVVLLEHPHLGLWSQYAHLCQIAVSEGQRVWAGEPVGGIGKGDPAKPFAAHLHFELRRQFLPPDNWPGPDRAAIERGYLNPELWLTQNMSPERRFERASAILWTPTRRRQIPGPAVVNLSSPEVVHVRLNVEV